MRQIVRQLDWSTSAMAKRIAYSLPRPLDQLVPSTPPSTRCSYISGHMVLHNFDDVQRKSLFFHLETFVHFSGGQWTNFGAIKCGKVNVYLSEFLYT